MPRAGEIPPTQEQLQERRRKVCEMRTDGVSWWNIGDKLGISDVQAYKDFHHEMDRLSALDETVLEARRIEVRRLDALLETWQPLAKAGNKDAADLCLKIANRRTKLLGLDEPVRREVDVLDRREQVRKLSAEQVVARLRQLQQRRFLVEPQGPVLEAEQVTEPVMALPDDGVKD